MLSSRNRRRDRALAWIGAAVSTVALISYFTLTVKVPFLRDSAWLNLLAVAIGLVLSAVAFARRRSVWSGVGLALSILWSLALVGFVFVLSNQLPPAERALKVGEIAPPFELPDQNGRMVALADFRGSNVVLIFYRGFW